MMSRIGGTGTAGGDGVVYSPSSIATSAMTPSNGARSTNWPVWLWASASVERACSISAWAARQAAAERLGRGRRLIQGIGRDDPLPVQPLQPVALAHVALDVGAGLLALRLGGLQLAAGDRHLGLGHVGVEAQQDVAGLDFRALAERDGDHLAADLGRELGSPPGLDRAGPGVGDRLLHPAPGRLDDGHRDRVRREHGGAQGDNGRHDPQEDADAHEPAFHDRVLL